MQGGRIGSRRLAFTMSEPRHPPDERFPIGSNSGGSPRVSTHEGAEAPHRPIVQQIGVFVVVCIPGETPQGEVVSVPV